MRRKRIGMAEREQSLTPGRVLVTGAAGFIGFHLARRLLAEGCEVFGLDNFNDYYAVSLKRDRHAVLESDPHYRWTQADLADRGAVETAFRSFRPECVVNLAAQAGVRYSLVNPYVYQKSNVEGFLNVLECCRHAPEKPRLVYASSSSVYGNSNALPFSESQSVDAPVSLYAATKRANELMAHCYSHLYGMQMIGLRFFTVYGPWGRPDMAYWLFAEAMLQGRPIRLFNRGEMLRDFTYVDDIVDGVVRCVRAPSLGRCEIFNIGNHRAERLTDLVALLARELGVESPAVELLPMQDGDVFATYADIGKIRDAVGFEPTTPLAAGIPKFVRWFLDYRRTGGTAQER